MPRKMTSPNGRIDNIAPALLPLAVPIASLKPDPDNARLHGDRNMDSIMQSLREHGQLKPVVVRAETRVVVAGNGTMEAAKRLGWTKLAANVQPMTEMQAISYGLADNRTAELAEWNTEVLARLTRLQQEAGENPTGWTAEELMALRMQGVKPQADPDDVPAAPTVPITKLGDIWLLGDHRLMCGDATNEKLVQLLFSGNSAFIVVTDPPYGVDYDPTWRDDYGPSRSFQELTGRAWDRSQAPRARGKVQNDKTVDWSLALKLFDGNVIYCWHAGVHAAEVARGLEEIGYSIRSQIIWIKQHFVFGRGAYHWQHEPCWYAVRDGKPANWTGDRKQSTVWEIQNLNPMGGNRREALLVHGTQKPVECMARPIRNHGTEADAVYDPFVGSGTTIIASQTLGRRCFAMDLDPIYCDVTIERWANFTGLDPIRERDGKTWSQLKRKRPQVVPAARNGKA